MNIFVTGQGTLHWGRLEFGNIGNYYVMEEIFNGLRKSFPNATIKTTFQFSDDFCKKFAVKMIPMECYWDFYSNNNLEIAKSEIVQVDKIMKGTLNLDQATQYVQTVFWSDIYIDVSGDIWGDNANFLGKDRFEVGLLKNAVAQNAGKPTFMLAGSPGPFNDARTKEMAKEIYGKFTCVTNREPLSTILLKKWGFPCERTLDVACPSFLFQPDHSGAADQVLEEVGLSADNRPVVGLIICGWDFVKGPFDRWPREDVEYEVFVRLVEYLTSHCNAKVCLLSHSNGFKVPPAKFELIHGRDYPIMKQLEKILSERGIESFMLNGIYSPELTKAIIGRFDMLISGRLHGAVAGLSQGVPTVTIDYGHEPKAHKLKGFNIVIGQERFVADPSSFEDIRDKVAECWENKEEVHADLVRRLPEVQRLAQENFAVIERFVNSGHI